MSSGLQVASDAFIEGGMIPARFTCDGADVSPGLTVSGLPGDTATWALLCDDPDAPAGDWVHWLVYDLPPALTHLAEGVAPAELAALGGLTGRNSWSNARYQGPCPPGGKHRYVFTVFALAAALKLPAGATKAQFLAAAKGHALGTGKLVGRYARQR